MNQTGMMSLWGLAAKLAGAMSVVEMFSLPQSFSRVAGVPVALIAWTTAGVSQYSLRSALPARLLPVFAVSPFYRGKRRCLFIQALLVCTCNVVVFNRATRAREVDLQRR